MREEKAKYAKMTFLYQKLLIRDGNILTINLYMYDRLVYIQSRDVVEC